MKPDCHISERLKGCCDACGAWPNRLHMPEDVHGWYCPECCPVCKPQAITQQPQPTETSADPAHQAA